MRRRKLQELIDDMYDDDEVRDHVRTSVEGNGTGAKIESGELQLPHPIDAHRSHVVATGRTATVRREEELESRLQELERRLADKQTKEGA